VWKALEVRMLGPERRAKGTRGDIHDGIGRRQLAFDAEVRRREREGSGEVDHVALLHDGHGSEGRVLAALPQDALEHLVQAHGWDDQAGGVLNGGREEAGTGPSAKYSSQPDESTTFTRDPARV
jgi:hypothetical protein